MSLKSSANESRKCKKELDRYLVEKGLDALVMINNEEVLLSAVAGYPELAVPAGYDNNGEPVGAVFVGKQFGEKELFNIDMRMNSSLKIENHLNCKRLNEKRAQLK